MIYLAPHTLLAASAIQDALGPIEGFRGDPVLYALLAILLGGTVFIWKYMQKKEDTAREELSVLRQENKDLVASILESNKLSTEAITLQSAVMREMRTDHKEALSSYLTKQDAVLEHLAEIKLLTERQKSNEP